MIIVLICSNLRNCLRSIGTIIITTETGLKQPQSHFVLAILHKSHHFSQFWCMFCTATLNISTSSEHINNTTHVPRLSFHFLWLCLYQMSFINSNIINKIKCIYWFNYKIVIGAQKRASDVNFNLTQIKFWYINYNQNKIKNNLNMKARNYSRFKLKEKITRSVKKNKSVIRDELFTLSVIWGELTI